MVTPSARLAPTRKSLFAHHREVYLNVSRELTSPWSPPCPKRHSQVARLSSIVSRICAYSPHSRYPFVRLSTEAQAIYLALKRPYTLVRSRASPSTRCSATLAQNSGNRRCPAARAVGEDLLIRINSVYSNLKIRSSALGRPSQRADPNSCPP